MSWSTFELRVGLAPWNRFKLSSKIFYWLFQGSTFFVNLLCFVCLVFAMPLRASVYMFSQQNTLVSPLLITWIGVSMSQKSLPKQLRHLVSFAGTWGLHLGVLRKLHIKLWFSLRGDSNPNDKYTLSERALWTMNFDTSIIKIGWKVGKLWVFKEFNMANI